MTFRYVLEILDAFSIEPRPLDVIVADYFRRHRCIGSRTRRMVADCAFSIMRLKRRLTAYLAAEGNLRPTNKDIVEFYLAVASGAITRAGNLVVSIDAAEAAERNFPGGNPAFHSFPDFLYEKMRVQHGDEKASRLAMALNVPAITSVRVNTRMRTRELVASDLANDGVDSEFCEYSRFGLRLPLKANLRELKSFSDGLIELQDEGSQLLSMLAVPMSGSRVLDYCAGAGGKSLAIAGMSDGMAKVFSTDIDASRLKKIAPRATRARNEGITVISMRDLERDVSLRGSFDVVLADCPCSGTGTLRRSPDIRWRLGEADISHFTEIQLEILRSALNFVKPGGILIYATCSIISDENESVALEFAKRNNLAFADPSPLLRRYDVDPSKFVNEKLFFSTDPSAHPMDGFFAVVFSV